MPSANASASRRRRRGACSRPRARSGLPVKLHAEQLSDQGGAALAARFGALSCDHLEYLSADGMRAMARGRHGGGAAARRVLLPARDASCRRSQALRDAGVPIAIATDHNPGSSPALSLLLMLNMACTLFRLTPEEALRGVTVNGARALGLRDRGTLAAGPARRLRRLGPGASERAGLLVRPQPLPARRRRRAWSATRMSDADLHAAPRHARRCWSACRTWAPQIPRRPCAARCAARAARSKTPTGILDRLYAFARELGASLLVPRHRAT